MNPFPNVERRKTLLIVSLMVSSFNVNRFAARRNAAPLGKRNWKMFYATLRDMVIYLHKDEHGFKRGAVYDNAGNAMRIHHSLAMRAVDYTKKQHVFRLQTSDWAQYLFQTRFASRVQICMLSYAERIDLNAQNVFFNTFMQLYCKVQIPEKIHLTGCLVSSI